MVEIKFIVNIVHFPGMLRRKTLVLDLDETLIHSHHDGVIRQTVKPGTPPDFVLKVSFSFFFQNLQYMDFGRQR